MAAHQPLTPAVFHVLLALADGDKHGYAIMKNVDEHTGGTLRMGAGTLYGTLQRLMESGLVAGKKLAELCLTTPASLPQQRRFGHRYQYIARPSDKSSRHQRSRRGVSVLTPSSLGRAER